MTTYSLISSQEPTTKGDTHSTPLYTVPMSNHSKLKHDPDVTVSGVPAGLPPMKGGFKQRFSELNNRFWILEICASILSWIALLVILVLLVFVDNKPVSLYSFGKYVTTVLEVLSTVLKASLMIPVVGSLGQLKWRLFRGSQPYGLAALEKFNDAARGSLGSLKLLKEIKFK
jgi:hypothetical protein